MTKELTAYILKIRSDLQSKIEMLEPSSGMTALQSRKAQILAADCKRFDAVIEEFSISSVNHGLRKRAA